MPQYDISVPGRGTYRVESQTELTDAQAWAAVQNQLAAPATSAPFNIKDTALSFGQGAVGGVKSIIEGFGAGSAPADYLGGISAALGSKMSAARQAEQQKRAQLEKEAGASGDALKDVAAGVGGVAEAPVQSLAQGIGSAAPTIALGIGAAALGTVVGAPVALAGAVGLGVKYLVGALQGAGSVKGSIYDAVRSGLEADGASKEEASRKAEAAQEYLGDNWGTIAAATGIGAVAGGTGIEKSITDLIKKPAVGAATKKASSNIAGRLLKEGVVEAVPEGIQGGQEKYAQNLALTRAGMATPDMQGVYGATARDALVGAMTGSTVGGVGAQRDRGAARDAAQAEALKTKQAEQQAAREAQVVKAAEAEAAKNTPEYAKQVVDNYLALEQQFQALNKQRKPTNKASPTFLADIENNKQLARQAAEVKKQAQALYPEYNALKDKVPKPEVAAIAAEDSGETIQTPAIAAELAKAQQAHATAVTAAGEAARTGNLEAAKAAQTEAAKFAEQIRTLYAANTDLPKPPPAPRYMQDEELQARLLQLQGTTNKKGAPVAGLYEKAVRLGEHDVANAHMEEMQRLQKQLGQRAENTQALNTQAADLAKQQQLPDTEDAFSTDVDQRRQDILDEQEAAAALAEKTAQQDRAAAMLGAQSAPLGGKKEVGEPQLRSVISRGVGVEGRAWEALQRDYDLAVAKKDRDAKVAAVNAMQDYKAAQKARAEAPPRGELTAQWAGIQPADVAAHQDALISRQQRLIQLLQAKPENVDSAQGRVRVGLVTDIETARGTQMTKEERQRLASEVNPVLAKLQAVKKPTMTDAKATQDALNTIRNKYTTTAVAGTAETVGPRETRGTELLQEQTTGTTNADLMAAAPRKTFTPTKSAPVDTGEAAREATLKAEQEQIDAQLAAHRAADETVRRAEESAIGAGDIPKLGDTAAILRNETERMDLQGRIDALQKKEHALSEWMLDVEPDAKTRAEHADVLESLQQAWADQTLLEAAQKHLVAQTRTRGAMPSTSAQRTPSELNALHTRKQEIQQQLAEVQAAKAAQEQAAQAAKRTAAGKETIASRQAATERDALARKQQAAREELGALPGMSVTHEAAEKAARLIEAGPARIERLREKIADPKATKTTRDKDKHDLKVLLEVLTLAHGVQLADPVKQAEAQTKLEARIVEISEQIGKETDLIEEKGFVGQKRKYRMDKIADLRREQMALRKALRGTFNPPTKTPIKGTSRILTLPERLAAATNAYAAVKENPAARAGDKKALETRVKALQKEVEAADDQRATDFLNKMLAIDLEGTAVPEAKIVHEDGKIEYAPGGKKMKGRVSQASRSEVTPGEQRTGSEASVLGENKTGARNSIVEQRRVTETNRAVGKPEQRVATKVADEIEKTAPNAETQEQAHAKNMAAAEADRARRAQVAEEEEARRTVARTKDKLEAFKARIKAAESRYEAAKKDKEMSAEMLELLEKRVGDLKQEQKDTEVQYKALVAQHGEPKAVGFPEKKTTRKETVEEVSARLLAQANADAVREAAKVSKEPQASREDAEAAMEAPRRTSKKAKTSRVIEDPYMEAFDDVADDTFARGEDPFAGEEEGYYAKLQANDNDTPLSAATRTALHDGDIAAAVKGLIAGASTPEVARFATNLQAHLEGVKIGTDEHVKHNGESVAGLYEEGRNAITMHPNALSEETALHELTHAATATVLNTPDAQLAPHQVEAKRGLTLMWERVRNSPVLFGEDYVGKHLGNVKEFASEVYSNPELRAKMDSVGKPISLLKRFATWVARMFGKGRTDSEKATALVDAILSPAKMQTQGESTPSLFRSKAPNYGSEAGSPLAAMADKYIARPVPFLERIKQNFALSFEQGVVDMRAAHAAAMKMGKDTTADSGKLTQQAIYDMRKGDQLMPLVQMAVMQGPPVSYTDSKGLHGIKSTGKNSLREVYEAVEKLPGNAEGKMALATNYMIAQRVANVGVEKAGWGDMKLDEAELAKVMDYVNANPELKAGLDAVRTKYNAYNEGLVNFMASTGAIPKSLAAKLLKDRDYVSMYRVDKNGHASILLGSHVINIGEVRHQRGLEALKGGDTKILPINESLLRNTTLLIGKSMDNQAAKSAAYAYQDLGAGTIKRGEGPSDPAVLHFHQEPDPKDSADEGKRWIKIDTTDTVLDGIPAEMIVKALEGTNIVIPSVLRFAAAASDMLRTGVTRMPMYAVRQLIRDPMVSTGTAGLGGNPLTAVLRAGKEFIAQTRGKSEAAERLAEKGLIQSQIFTGDTHDLDKLALQLADGKNNHNAIQHLFAVMDRASMRADAATRVLVHENALKNGLSEVEADFMTMESMNFHKRGASATIQYAHRMIPFFSSQIQGLSVLAKAMRGNMPFNEQLQIKKKFFNNAVLLFASGLAYAAAMEDDDYYKNAKPRDKMSNWFVHLPGVDEPIKIPIPFEYGFFFSAAVAAVEGMKEDTDNAQQFAAIQGMLLNAIPGYSNKGVPQFVKPIAELATNRDFYSWNPIESASQTGLDPERRFNRNTTEMAKRLSEVLPVLSPIQIERLVNGYFGQAPLMIAGAVNSIFAEEGTAPRAEGHVTEMPFIGQSFQRKFGGEDADATYTLANKAVMAKKTLDDIAKEGNPAKAKEYQQSHITELRGAALAEKFKAAMAELTKAEKAIRLQGIPPDAKQKRLDGIDETRQRVAEQYKKAFQRISAAA